MGLGGGGNAAYQAEQQEKARQAQIAQTTGRINTIYDSPARAAQQQGFFKSLRDMLVGDVNRQQVDAKRNLKFANARSGMTGSSVARDNNKQLGDEYSRSLLEATRRAQGALADVKAGDEDSRARLISMAQAGLDTGSAATSAANSMRVNLDKARASSMGGIPDAFKQTSDIWKRSQEAAERRRGMTAPVGSLYGDPWS